MPAETFSRAVPSMVQVDNLFIIGAIVIFVVIFFAMMKYFMEK